jgi:hypothetical protein
MWFKNKNTRTKNKNTKCARQTWKWIFIMLTYANMNMKKIWGSYGAKSCLRLTLNILKEMKGLISIYTALGTLQQKGAYCDPNILANNKEIRFRKPAVANTNSSQTLKPLRNPHLRTRTIASSSQLPKLNPSQHISDYNVFCTRFAIHNTSKIIENKSNIAKT